MAGDPLAGARRVAGVEVADRVNALERFGWEDRRYGDVVFLPEMVEAVPEPGEGPAGDLHRLLASRREHHVPGDAQRGQVIEGAPERRPLSLVGVGQRP